MGKVSYKYLQTKGSSVGVNKLESLSLGDLIKLCRTGDKQAWDQFFRHYTNHINQQIIRTLLNRQHINIANDRDIIRDIYIEIVEKLYCENAIKNLIEPDAVVSWLETISKNKTLDWLQKYYSQKNMPKRQSEFSSMSFDTPIDEQGNLTIQDIMEDRIYDFSEETRQLRMVLNDMEELSEKQFWVLRLKIIFYDLLTDEEIKSLATYINKPFKHVTAQIDGLIERLCQKWYKKEAKLSDATRVEALIRHLESRLLEDIKHHDLSEEECKIREAEISKKSMRMKTLWQSGSRFIEPTNDEVADILEISKEKVGKVSVRLRRAREKLKSMRDARMVR